MHACYERILYCDDWIRKLGGKLGIIHSLMREKALLYSTYITNLQITCKSNRSSYFFFSTVQQLIRVDTRSPDGGLLTLRSQPA